MLVGAHRIELHTIDDGKKFTLHGRTYTKVAEYSRNTEDWEIEYRDEFTQQTYRIGPYTLVKRGNK